MKIEVDTNSLSLLDKQILAMLCGTVIGTVERISHADNPETGIVPIPGVGPAHGGEKPISVLTAELTARGLPPPPSLDVAAPPAAAVFTGGEIPPLAPAAAAVFVGGAAAPVPPVEPTVGATPPPPPPASVAGSASPVPPVPPASSPSTAATPPALPVVPGASVEVDSTGLPWDGRIHSANRAKNKGGGWTKKRGLNDEGLIKRIETELRAVMALPPAAANLAAPPVPPPPPPGETPPASVAFGVTGNAPAAPTTFPDFMVALTPAMTQGRLQMALILEACQAEGVPGLPLLAARPDLVPKVFEYIRARVQL